MSEYTDEQMAEIEAHWCENCCNFGHPGMDGMAACALTGTMAYCQEYGGDCIGFNVPAADIAVKGAENKIQKKEGVNMTGKKVIIRADRAGVFFGTLKEQNGSEVTMEDVRRLWYWDGAASLSQLAVDGTSNPSECKFTVTVPCMKILGVIEIIPCSDKAINSIEGVAEWKR